MKNTLVFILTLFLANSSNAQSDTSFINYHLFVFPQKTDAYTDVYEASDSTFIALGSHSDNSTSYAAANLLDTNFTVIKSGLLYNTPSLSYDFYETNFQFSKDSNSVYIFIPNSEDSMLHIHQFDFSLDPVSQIQIDVSDYPELRMHDTHIQDSTLYLVGEFRNTDDQLEAIYFKLKSNGDTIDVYKGSDLFSNSDSNSRFYKIYLTKTKSYIYYNGFWENAQSNSGVISIDSENNITPLHDWDEIKPWYHSFEFLDSTEYIYNARNHNLTFPNWWAQYYENLDTDQFWEAEDNSAWDFTSITISGFTVRKNGNILAYGNKENFFNTDNVEFPNLANVENFSSAYLTELDRNTGERLWEYMYPRYDKDGEIELSIIHKVIELTDGSLVAVGSSELDNVGDDVPPKSFSAMIMKLPPNGCFNNDCDDLLAFTSSTEDQHGSFNNSTKAYVSPNPSENLIQLHGIDTNNTAQLRYQLISSDGSIIRKNLPISHSGSVDISGLNPGIYILRVIDKVDKMTYTIKFVKQ